MRITLLIISVCIIVPAIIIQSVIPATAAENRGRYLISSETRYLPLFSLRPMAMRVTPIEKPPLTKKIFTDLCIIEKQIPWREYRLTQEFARFILRLVAENDSVPKEPWEITSGDFFRIRIKKINGVGIPQKSILSLLTHPDLQIKNSLPSTKISWDKLKKLAAYKPRGPEKRSPLTEEIFINCLKEAKDVPWQEHSLTHDFAEFILSVVLDNNPKRNSPQELTQYDFNQSIRAIRGMKIKPRITAGLLKHPDLQEEGRPILESTGLKNLKKLAGLSQPESPMPYEEPKPYEDEDEVTHIIAPEVVLDNVSEKQLKGLIVAMRGGNVAAERRLINLFLENNLKATQEWARKHYWWAASKEQFKDLNGYLQEKYLLVIKRLNPEYATIKQVVKYLVKSLQGYARTYLKRLLNRQKHEGRSLDRKGYKGNVLGDRFGKGPTFLDSTPSRDLSTDDIINIRIMMHDLIKAMKQRKVSARDINMFFDRYLGEFSLRKLTFKYRLSYERIRQIITKRIPKKLSKVELYTEFLQEAKLIREEFGFLYIDMIEEDLEIAEFRKGLRLLPEERATLDMLPLEVVEAIGAAA